MHHSTSYSCSLFRRDGKPATTIQVTALTDTDAIILGDKLEKKHRGCAGFAIRAGDRLVYVRMGYLKAGPSRSSAAK